MRITIDVPDSLPKERLQQRIKELEGSLREEAHFLEALKQGGQAPSPRDDPWINPDVELPSVDTGIEDFSINHDHYLYGTSKTS
jgi:hypothetical protein